MKKLTACLLSIILVLSLLSGCGSKESKEVQGSSDENVVKVGVLLPLSGDVAAMGIKQRAGIELFFDTLNENGGIKSMNGAKVELIFADSTGKPEVGVTEIERLITQQKVDALMGPYNSAVGAATAPIAEKYKTPLVLTSSCADDIMRNGYTYVFRPHNNISNCGEAIGAFFKDYAEITGFQPKTFGIVYENTEWGKGGYNTIAQIIKDSGWDLVLSETYEANTSDMSSIVNKIKAVKPDVVIPFSYLNDALILTQQLAEYGANTTILANGGGFTNSDYIKNAGKNSEYTLSVTGWADGVLNYKGPDAKAINEKYKEIVGENLDEYSGLAYFDASILANALERAGTTDKEKVRQALADTDIKAGDPELALVPYEGVKFGEINGMTNQNIYSQVCITQVINGKFEVVAPYSLVGDKTPVVLPAPAWDKR